VKSGAILCKRAQGKEANKSVHSEGSSMARAYDEFSAFFDGGHFHAQGATQSCSGTIYCPLRGQGATEYLVLLAIVLIVALVSVALLGFFPGMASDAQVTQSQMYWQSATPIAMTDMNARYRASAGGVYPHITVTNTGPYPIRITKVIGADGVGTSLFYGSSCGLPYTGSHNISDYYYLAPGEEKYFTRSAYFGVNCNKYFVFQTGASGSYFVGGASSVCQNSSESPGFVYYKSFGFEYIKYIDGQAITKRQIGPDMVIKCIEPY